MNGKLIIKGLVVFCCSFPGAVKAQQFLQKSFAADDTNFPNPERGMFHQKEVHSGAYSPLSKDELVGFRNDGISLVNRVFYLENFVNGDISADYLNSVQRDFNIAREAGVKLIVRFAYTQSTFPPYGDATPARVLAHIDQLSGILKSNSDIIALVHAGFIGAWGEWYYTSNFSLNPGNSNDQNWIDRKAVVDALLNAISINRTVALRTPAYKRKLTGTNDPLSAEEAFSGSERSRIGHHNDCFLASANDVGTYVNVDDEKNYIAQETLYVPLGGETCGVDVPLSQCPNALAEIKRLHWSYLNIDYHPSVLDGFSSGGCLPEIRKNLGYRYRLTKSSLQQTGSASGIFSADFSLLNDGWANPYNPRLVEVVLKNNDSGKEYFFKTSEDPRRWPLTDTIKFNVTVGLPGEIENGSYAIYLNLPDPEENLYRRPEYSIHLANKNIWNDQTGYNDLGAAITIGNTGLPSYSGTSFLLPRYPLNPSLAVSPLFATSSSKEALLYWGLTPADPYRVIERSDNGGDYHPLDVIPGYNVYYKDENLTAATSYQYRYYLRGSNSTSTYSPAITTITSGSDPDYYSFNVDGNAGEWKIVPPLATQFSGGDTYTFRFFSGPDSLNVLIEGQSYSAYSLFINSDNLSATGIQQSTWQESGFDFLLRNDSLYKANSGAWSFISKIISVKNGSVRETGIPLTDLNIGPGNILIRAGCILTTGGQTVLLPFPESRPASYVRLTAPPVPSSLTVSNSQTIPETRLVVHWSDCVNCDGVVLERSNNGTDGFQQIFKSSSEVIYLDDNLTLNTSYYYRLYSYNMTGKSDYSPVVEGTTMTTTVTGLGDPDNTITVYPNPVTNKFTVAGLSPWQHGTQMKIYNAVGNSIDDTMVGVERKSDTEFVVDASRLSSGVYIIRMADTVHRLTFKIVKL